MEHKSNIFADCWLKDIYGTTPMFILPESTTSWFEHSDSRSDPRLPAFGPYEDMNPRRDTQTKPVERHDYFSSLAHSVTDLSSPTISRASPFSSSSAKDHPTKITKCKPGRPRTNCHHEVCTSSTSPRTTSSRIPHNQVEQKYRHSLNAEMARLRVAIPKIQEWDTDPETSLKPSKAMVLASAVSYIRELERERDMLKQQRQHST